MMNKIKRVLLLFALLCGMTTVWGQKESKNMNYKLENRMKQKLCQSCGMPLTEEVLGTNADGSKNEDYCMVLLAGNACHSSLIYAVYPRYLANSSNMYTFAASKRIKR